MVVVACKYVVSVRRITAWMVVANGRQNIDFKRMIAGSMVVTCVRKNYNFYMGESRLDCCGLQICNF